jgi:hypothetical protein
VTYPGNGEGRLATGALHNTVSSNLFDGNALLTEPELVELADLRRRTFRDDSRETWLDLQEGDQFPHLGELFGVLWVGPIDVHEGYYLRKLAVMRVDGGPYRFEWASAHRPLLGGVRVATPEEAARTRTAWNSMSDGLRGELERLRAEVAG